MFEKNDMGGIGKDFDNFLEARKKNPKIQKTCEEIQRKFIASQQYKEKYATSQVVNLYEQEDSPHKFMFMNECYQMMEKSRCPLLSSSENPAVAAFMTKMKTAHSLATSDLEDRIGMMTYSGSSQRENFYPSAKGLCVTLEIYKRREGVYDLVRSLSVPK